MSIMFAIGLVSAAIATVWLLWRRWKSLPAWTDVPMLAGTTLIVVDMQRYFVRKLVTRAQLEPAVISLVEAARTIGMPIVLLRFDGFGRLLAPIRRSVARYDYWAQRIKFDRDGSDRIANACKRHGFGTQVFRVCGVNADECVYETCLGLLREFPGCRVEVIVDATSTYTKGYQWHHYQSAEAAGIYLVHHDGAPYAPPYQTKGGRHE